MEAALGGAEAARQQRMIFADVVAETTVRDLRDEPRDQPPHAAVHGLRPRLLGPGPAADGKALASKKEIRKEAPKQ